MKTEGKLGANYLKGVMGDEINAFLYAIGHNYVDALVSEYFRAH